MGYYDLAKIKDLVDIDTTDNSQDTSLKRYGNDADDFINTQLAVYDVSTPVEKPNDQIRRLSERLGAAWYIYWNAPKHPMDGVKDMKKEIEQHIRAVYGKKTDTQSNATINKVGKITGTEPAI